MVTCFPKERFPSHFSFICRPTSVISSISFPGTLHPTPEAFDVSAFFRHVWCLKSFHWRWSFFFCSGRFASNPWPTVFSPNKVFLPLFLLSQHRRPPGGGLPSLLVRDVPPEFSLWNLFSSSFGFVPPTCSRCFSDPGYDRPPHPTFPGWCSVLVCFCPSCLYVIGIYFLIFSVQPFQTTSEINILPCF